MSALPFEASPAAGAARRSVTLAHVGVDAEFRNWVLRENLLADDAVVIEWVGQNPLAHQDPRYAPVGDYMFTRLDDCVRQVS